MVPSRHPWPQGHLTILGQRSNLERPVRVMAVVTSKFGKIDKIRINDGGIKNG